MSQGGSQMQSDSEFQEIAKCLTHGRSARIPVGNLIPGRVYAFRLRAVGGSTGFSDWSDPITRRAA